MSPMLIQSGISTVIIKIILNFFVPLWHVSIIKSYSK